jgi:hypothetical protein
VSPGTRILGPFDEKIRYKYLQDLALSYIEWVTECSIPMCILCEFCGLSGFNRNGITKPGGLRKKTAESQSAREDERTETTILLRRIYAMLF